jgi:Polysaccharide biosynthesis protein
MGEPVRIADVAQTLIRRSGRKLDIVYTGLRPGEKLHEDLLGTDERDARPSHPLITQAHVPPLAPASGAALSVEVDRELLTKELAGLCLAPSLAAVLSSGEIDSSGSARFVARANARALRGRPAGISLADDDALALPADS